MKLKFKHQEANFLKYVLTHPCASPYFLMIETFLECLPELFWTLITPDLTDIIEFAGRSIGPEPGGHLYRKGGRIEAREIHPMGGFSKHAYGMSKAFLFLLEPVDFIGFWWMIYEAEDQFFYKWHSLLRERKFCTAATSTGPFARATAGQAANFNATYNAITMEILRQNRAGWGNNSFGVDVPDGIYDCCLAVTAHTTTGSDLSDCTVSLVITTAAGVRHFDAPLQSIPANGTIDWIVRCDFIAFGGAGGNVGWATFSPTHATGLAHIDKGDVFVMRREF